MPPKRVKKVMTLPINVIFSHLQVRVCVCVLLCVMEALEIAHIVDWTFDSSVTL
jgi:hypothetical protein